MNAHENALPQHYAARVVWPRDLETELRISTATRWRWERRGFLPARDVHVGPRSGWRDETIAAHFGRRP